MIRNTIFGAIVLLVVGFVSCTGKSESDKYRKGWILVWEDNFDTKNGMGDWTKIPRGTEPMERYMSDNDALYVMDKGNLILRAVNNTAESAKVPYLTGAITREGLKQGTVRRIEVRARTNPAVGAVFYASLIPKGVTGQISIDIMERFGLDEFIYQSVTSEYTTTQGMPDNPPSSSLVGINPNEYHVYSMERYPDSVVFYVDNLRTKKYPRILTDIPGQYPYDDLDFDLRIGVRLNKDVDSTGLPADLLIDWVRYYEPASPAVDE